MLRYYKSPEQWKGIASTGMNTERYEYETAEKTVINDVLSTIERVDLEKKERK